MRPSSTIIIPAHNEAAYIGACLQALLDQDTNAGEMRIIVAANACTDDTVKICLAKADDFAARNCELRILDLATPGKIAALNSAEDGLEPGVRIYLDADVVCDPAMVGQLCTVLSATSARYATGQLSIAPAQSAITRAYARFWQELPFFKSGAVGAGLFALNAAGRSRWGLFPVIISDDTFVRLSFEPDERIEVPCPYIWPMVEGFSGLVKVRRRQDAGVTEVRALYPQLMKNDNSARLSKATLVKLALRYPWPFAVYVATTLAVKSKRPSRDWVRGR